VRVLGLDLGERRIGLAVSDAEGRIAFPAGALTRRGRRSDLAALRALVIERGVERIVVGLPLHMSGRAGAEAASAKAFADELAGATGVPVDTFDERWTTREAERALREAGARPSRRRADVDSVAAALLLRAYLESRSRAGLAGDRERADG
jgi:putative Holliday junction resolvase